MPQHYSIMTWNALLFLKLRIPGPWIRGEVAAAVSGLAAGAIVAYLLYGFVRRVPWPRPFRFRFILVHIVAMPVFGAAWILLSIAFETMYTGNPLETRTLWRFLNLPSELPQISILFYGVVTGIAYSVERRARNAQLETEAARAQLAALRAQVHPHFLFNALHTVVQLIPLDPSRASEAAELVGSLLRRTLEEQRDEVTLDNEWGFVSRYLEMERMRFGDRLQVRADVDPQIIDELVPSFALQTLVENAVRHGAANRIEPTAIVVSASMVDSKVQLSVLNQLDRVASAHNGNGAGTGLSRLRERLRYLYGDNASLTYGDRGDGIYQATLVVPRARSRR
ncbi:MAG TPA: histidine kinase [Gemmatimonadaceae bacterium]